MWDKSVLIDMMKTEMPFGKYQGKLIYQLPMYYLEWLHKKGMPKGKLGMQLSTIYEIKLNGLDEIFLKLK
jgi:uncharacterized protein (DUF3820 family)